MPASLKMTTPCYQNIASDQIPERIRDDGVKIRGIAGEVDGIRGPVNGIFAAPTYVMSTQDEILQALEDLRNGTFVKN